MNCLHHITALQLLGWLMMGVLLLAWIGILFLAAGGGRKGFVALGVVALLLGWVVTATLLIAK